MPLVTLPSLTCKIFFCWGFEVSMTFHFASNSACKLIHNHKIQSPPLHQWLQLCDILYSSSSQPFSHEGPVSRKTIIPQMWWWEGWFGDYSSTLHLLCTLFLLLLHQIHPRPSGIRSRRLGKTDWTLERGTLGIISRLCSLLVSDSGRVLLNFRVSLHFLPSYIASGNVK